MVQYRQWLVADTTVAIASSCTPGQGRPAEGDGRVQALYSLHCPGLNRHDLDDFRGG